MFFSAEPKKCCQYPLLLQAIVFFAWQLLLWRRKSTTEVKFVIFLTNDHHQWRSFFWATMARKGNQKHTGGMQLYIKCPIPKWLKPAAESCWKVGYLPDGTPMNRAGNCINHPETIGPDPHAPGIVFEWFSGKSKFGNPKNSWHVRRGVKTTCFEASWARRLWCFNRRGLRFFQGTTKTPFLPTFPGFCPTLNLNLTPRASHGWPEDLLFYFGFLVDAESTGAKCDNSMILLDHPKAT